MTWTSTIAGWPMPQTGRERGSSSCNTQGETSFLLSDVLLQRSRSHFSTVNIACGIDGDAFCSACAGCIFVGIRDECGDNTVTDAPNPDSSFPARSRARDGTGFGIRHVNVFLFVDEDSAGSAEL